MFGDGCVNCFYFCMCGGIVVLFLVVDVGGKFVAGGVVKYSVYWDVFCGCLVCYFECVVYVCFGVG